MSNRSSDPHGDPHRSGDPHGSGAAVTSTDQPVDPVRARRAVIAKWTQLANRVGYLFVLIAMGIFFVALTTDFSSVMATLVIVAFVIGCVLLAPSIILGYAVKAADRDDRERGF
jgi:hypothetical protein